MPALLSRTQLAIYLLLWQEHGTYARPARDDDQSSITEPNGLVTSIATRDGKPVTATFTPTNIAISGLTTPLTAATTITTTNSAGDSVAIAIAAGAGVAAGGGIAAWLFKPVAGGPPAPTSPPELPTPTVSNVQTTSSASESSTTSSEAETCPFPTQGSKISIAPVRRQPQWTAAIPTQTLVTKTVRCTKQGENRQLLRGTDPGYLKELATIFCKSDLSKDQSRKLGQTDIQADSRFKHSRLDGVRADFTFEHKLTDAGCAKNCVEAFDWIALSCQYNQHVLFGGGSLGQGCGTYKVMVDAEPNTELECAASPNPISSKSMYRDAARDAIDSFCGAQDGKTVYRDNDGSYVKETAFTVSYASECRGSGGYKIEKELCKKYLMQTLDGCDTNSRVYKHGGKLVDTDNCGSFEFHPTNFDIFACYPENKDRNYITGANHITIDPDMAEDAISQFCDRSGDGQSFSLDPEVVPEEGEFSEDTCKKKGMAACGYYYTSDGKRVTTAGSAGDIFIRMNARFFDPGDGITCGPRQYYAISGERCKSNLRKVMGIEPKGQCVGSEPNKLDLGSFLESGDKGCVLWNMWAVATH